MTLTTELGHLQAFEEEKKENQVSFISSLLFLPSRSHFSFM